MVNKVSKLFPRGFRILRLEIVYSYHSPPTKGGGGSLANFCSSRARKMAAPNFEQEDWGKRDIYLAQFKAIISKRELIETSLENDYN